MFPDLLILLSIGLAGYLLYSKGGVGFCLYTRWLGKETRVRYWGYLFFCLFVLFSRIGAASQSFSLVLGGSSELEVAEGGLVLSLLMVL